MPPQIKKNVPLQRYTTLGVGGNAEYFVEVETVDALKEMITWAKKEVLPVTILAGGSNVLITDGGINGLVLRPLFREIIYSKSPLELLVTAGAGVVLDDLVKELTEKELWGLENLSGIPGSVGAVPIQNVGAYGVEAKDIIEHVTVYDPALDAIRDMSASECVFAYRDSIFKHETGKHLVILSVTFKVSSNAQPILSYKDLEATFRDHKNPTVQEIRDAVLQIRSKKFPDWTRVGTAGSFFKNPIISHEEFIRLQKEYPELPGYPVEGNMVKVSLGWILDRVCNVRGYREGEVGLYEAQALVLVCTKGIKSQTVLDFSEKIIANVFEKTKIKIEREVTLLT